MRRPCLFILPLALALSPLISPQAVDARPQSKSVADRNTSRASTTEHNKALAIGSTPVAPDDANRAEKARVRFTDTLQKEGDHWRVLLSHRDIRPFDEHGRYLAQFTLSASNAHPQEQPEKSSSQTQGANNSSAPGQTEQQIGQVNRDFDDAEQRRDLSAIERLLADDFIWTTYGGTVFDRAQTHDHLKAGDAHYDLFQSDQVQVRVYGNVAVLTARLTRSGRNSQRDLSGEFRYTRVFVNRHGAWRIAAYQVTQVADHLNAEQTAAPSQIEAPVRKEAKPEPSSAVQNLEVKHIRVNGTELAYVEKGAGEPVVLVHGFISDYRTWAGQIDEFAKHYHVIAYSRRYHYPNAWVGDASDYSVDLHVRDLAALIQALNLGRVHLIGHSYGGRVATLVAIAHPELVRTLIVAETQFASLLKPRPEWKQAVADQKKQYEIASRAEQSGGPAEALKTLFESGGDKGAFDRLPVEDRQRYLDNARTLVPARREVIQLEDFTCADVQRIKAPFMWVEADSGAGVMRLVGDELVKCRPQIERVTIAKAKHGMMHDNPGAFNQAVLAFMQRHSALTDIRPVARLGLLSDYEKFGGSASPSDWLDSFQAGLRGLGYIEGKNVLLEPRYANRDPEKLARFAAELADMKVDVIVAASTTAAKAAKAATNTIPIVFWGAEPLSSGLVANLDHPGENVTGVTANEEEQREFLAQLKEIVPGLKRVAILFNRSYAPVPGILNYTETGARELGLSLQLVEVTEPGDLPGAFEAMKREGTRAVLVLNHRMFFQERAKLAALAIDNKIALSTPYLPNAEAGALIAHEADFEQVWRMNSGYIDKILKGATPGDLPVQRLAAFHYAINLKTARALGLRIPEPILKRAAIVIPDSATVERFQKDCN